MAILCFPLESGEGGSDGGEGEEGRVTAMMAICELLALPWTRYRIRILTWGCDGRTDIEIRELLDNLRGGRGGGGGRHDGKILMYMYEAEEKSTGGMQMSRCGKLCSGWVRK